MLKVGQCFLVLMVLVSSVLVSSPCAEAAFKVNPILAGLACESGVCKEIQVDSSILKKLTPEDLLQSESAAREAFAYLVNNQKDLSSYGLALVKSDSVLLQVSIINLKTAKIYNVDLRKSVQVDIALNGGVNFRWLNWLIKFIRCAVAVANQTYVGCAGLLILIGDEILGGGGN